MDGDGEEGVMISMSGHIKIQCMGNKYMEHKHTCKNSGWIGLDWTGSDRIGIGIGIGIGLVDFYNLAVTVAMPVAVLYHPTPARTAISTFHVSPPRPNKKNQTPRKSNKFIFLPFPRQKNSHMRINLPHLLQVDVD